MQPILPPTTTQETHQSQALRKTPTKPQRESQYAHKHISRITPRRKKNVGFDWRAASRDVVPRLIAASHHSSLTIKLTRWGSISISKYLPNVDHARRFHVVVVGMMAFATLEGCDTGIRADMDQTRPGLHVSISTSIVSYETYSTSYQGGFFILVPCHVNEQR